MARTAYDPSTPRCSECGEPYDPDVHNPPVRSFSDVAIMLHEDPDHSDRWEEFGATPGSVEIDRARRDAA